MTINKCRKIRDKSYFMKKTIALKYDKSAPEVIAKARGELAKKMLQIAQQYDISVYKDEDLAELLYKLELNQEIPETLYNAVAAVMAFCYEVNSEFRERIDSMIGNKGNDIK